MRERRQIVNARWRREVAVPRPYHTLGDPCDLKEGRTDLELSGKVSPVTRGSRGIVRATTIILGGEGRGVAVYARERGTLEATMAKMSVVSADGWGVTADATNASDVEREE